MARGPAAPCLSEAIRSYHASAPALRRAPSTRRAYETDLARFAAFVAAERGSDPPVADLDPGLLRAFAASLRTGAVKDATIKRRLIALRGLLQFCSDRHWIADDLSRLVVLPRPERPLPEMLPLPLSRWHPTTFSGLRDRAVVMLLLSTGARTSEILNLDVEHWRRYGDSESLRVGDDQREVIVTRATERAVNDYLRRRSWPSKKDALATPALFISFQPRSRASPDNRLSPAGLRLVCRGVAEELGIPPFTPAQLRHTHALQLRMRGLLNQASLGNRSRASHALYNRYFAEQKLARRAVEELFDGIPLPASANPIEVKKESATGGQSPPSPTRP